MNLFNYYLEQVDSDHLINYIMNGSGWDRESSEDGVKFYLSTIDEINKNGGVIYRLLYLDDIKNINYKQLGKHFTLDKDALSNFEYSLRDGGNGGKPYLLTIRVDPNSIDKNESIDHWKELPYEYEVRLNKATAPKVINIEEYKYLKDAI